jgi:hypothetical protein
VYATGARFSVVNLRRQFALAPQLRREHEHAFEVALHVQPVNECHQRERVSAEIARMALSARGAIGPCRD